MEFEAFNNIFGSTGSSDSAARLAYLAGANAVSVKTPSDHELAAWFRGTAEYAGSIPVREDEP